MSMILAVIGAGMLACGMAASSLMLRESTLEELRILLKTESTASILSGRWGEEEFPELFGSDWKDDTRGFYAGLMRGMSKKEYGSSRKLLRALIRIEDERQAAKGKTTDDSEFTKRERALIESYKRKEDFSGFLAAFLEKRHLERV